MCVREREKSYRKRLDSFESKRKRGRNMQGRRREVEEVGGGGRWEEEVKEVGERQFQMLQSLLPEWGAGMHGRPGLVERVCCTNQAMTTQQRERCLGSTERAHSRHILPKIKMGCVVCVAQPISTC